MRVFSYKDRPVHLGPYPLERLQRASTPPDLTAVPPMQATSFHDPSNPENLVNAMTRYQAMLDAIRDGLVKKERGVVPTDRQERSNHLKAFGYYHDASQAGVCELHPEMLLPEPIVNPDIGQLAEDLRTKQTKTLAAGIDVVMAELKDTMEAPPTRVDHHTHALVFLYEFPRDPERDETGGDWIQEAQAQRACLRAAETVIVLSNYLRLLGYEARGHTGACSDVDLNKLAVAAGLGEVRQTSEGPAVYNPYLGREFGIGAITTTFELAPDLPLAPSANQGLAERLKSHGPAWWMGGSPKGGFVKNAFNAKPFAKRRFKDGAFPFEKLKRVDETTTFIDELRVARVPKRTDMFARAIFGDMGKHVQQAARNGNYVRKSAASFGPRRPLAAFVLLQDGEKNALLSDTTKDPQRNADNIKAALYFLGADAVGISRCPDWTYYSHDALGEPLAPYHKNAISVVIDQGHETMDGASGDDWIACSQSMRAYLRFSLLGGVVAEQIRNLGYSARSHTVMDGEVLQPPLLLLSGLGEVSRIGEVILNPYLGPRLKSGAITTNMPLVHDKPIDFGLQNFCNSCNKCARECPSGAITAGPKTMFNGYEIWKSDSQKCTTYRLTNAAGAMCGRCMKTCPWNLEGLFAEAPFRWAASHIPGGAKTLAKLDDKLGNGSINPVKKWWWDLEMEDEGPYTLSDNGSNVRELQTDLELKFEDQTLAVYPANLAPPPYPFPFPMDREAGIKAYQDMLTPEQYRAKLARGETEHLAHEYKEPEGPAPVMRVQVSKAETMTDGVTKYEFTSLDGSPLPEFDAGAHLDVVVAPEFFRQYSLSGDPADRSKYQIGVLREDEGRGGSKLLHKIFQEGRKVFISRPLNHFPLDECATKTYLMGGGIGITPMIAMAHRLHAINAEFELHYSCSRRENAGFLEDLATMPWADKVQYHFSDEGNRVNLDALLSDYHEGYHLYTCGPERYMTSVLEAGERNGWPEPALHKEYFTIPETPDYENHDFTLRLADSGREIKVDAEQTAADALIAAGIHVDVKCGDGICGVCKCGLKSGEVEHRDFVLSNAQREQSLILCQSRAAEENGVIEIDL
ncbi:2Fe-2S iron-sulfur cluster-binding protein [Pseudomaricurvus alkylphenolicus]|uniref:2Fe-2S iron-sulfur cluster-binding protein n=1 Tax=Pseudomaricurvus alkylphenolicus TaxID=1306991 RepID=UPI00197EB610|nr:reductive dehalogenase domain-containing protein [Pseudomaricurvus alkylphenolicus]